VRKKWLIYRYGLQNNQKQRKQGLQLLLFLACFLSFQSLYAQQKPLGTEFGFRYGAGPGLTYRFYLQEKTGFEILFMKSGQSLLVTALYEKLQFRQFAGLYTYYGLGASVGGWNDQQRMSLDMALGSCYFVPYVPINVDFSLRPYLIVAGPVGVNAELALSVRWVF